MTDANGMLADTFTPTSDASQTVTAAFDGATASTSVHFVALDTWINTSGGDWSAAANWSGATPSQVKRSGLDR